MGEAAHVTPSMEDVTDQVPSPTADAHEEEGIPLVAYLADPTRGEFEENIEGLFQEFPVEHCNLSKQSYMFFLQRKKEAEMELKWLQLIREGLNNLTGTSEALLKEEEQRLQSEIGQARICRDERLEKIKDIKSRVEEARKDAKLAEDALNDLSRPSKQQKIE